MKSAYKILSLFGIDIEVHWLFLLVIIGFLIIDPISSLLFAIIFVFVTLHEVSHSLIAKRKGIKVRKIILLPIGGMAVIENAGRLKPWDEIKMAVAGPMFNFVIAALCIIAALAFNYPIFDKALLLFEEVEIALGELIFLFVFYANLMLGAFNLLVPAFPMDGGRIFRAILALKLNYVKATEIAKNVGMVFGVLLGLYGLFIGNIFLIVIGVFIIFGANGEYRGVLLTEQLSKINVDNLITKEVFLLGPDINVKLAVEDMLRHRVTNALVQENKVFDLSYLHNIPKKKWNVPVSKISKKLPVFDIKTNIVQIAGFMTEKNFPFVIITKGRQMLGVIYLDDIQKALKMVKYGIQDRL